MKWSLLFSSLALVFVFEGILPFLSPTWWRRTLLIILGQSDKAIRITGFISMLTGLVVLYFIRSFVGE